MWMPGCTVKRKGENLDPATRLYGVSKYIRIAWRQ